MHDVALRDRRRLSEDGVLIVVATIAARDERQLGGPDRADRARVRRRLGRAARRAARGGGPEFSEDLLRNDIIEIKLLQEHLHDELGQLVYDRTHRRPMILPVVVEV